MGVQRPRREAASFVRGHGAALPQGGWRGHGNGTGLRYDISALRQNEAKHILSQSNRRALAHRYVWNCQRGDGTPQICAPRSLYFPTLAHKLERDVQNSLTSFLEIDEGESTCSDPSFMSAPRTAPPPRHRTLIPSAPSLPARSRDTCHRSGGDPQGEGPLYDRR